MPSREENEAMNLNTDPAAAPAAAATTEPDMMQIAREADARIDNPSTPSTTEATATPEKKTEGQPADPKAPNSAPGKPEEKGSAKPGEKPADKPAEKPDDKSEGTAFAKAKKEQERQQQVLANFQKEKEAFRAEKARIEGEVQSLRQEVAELRQRAAAAPSGPVKDKHGLSADDYDKLAKDYAAQGNDDMAAAAKERAEELRKQSKAAPGAAAPAVESFRTPEFQRDWQRNVQELIAAQPELDKPDNPVTRAANMLVNDPTWGRFFRSHPAGIKAAVEVAQLMQRAESTKTLQTELDATKTELTTAKAEIERLNKLMQPQGSPPGGPAPAPKKAEEMTSDDIMAAARAADQGTS